MKLRSLNEVNIRNKQVIVREDFNMPLEQGHIVSDARIRAALPTIKTLLKHNAAVILLSHLGRPPEGQFDHHYSLAIVAEALTEHLEQPVHYVPNWLNGVEIEPGEIVLCENVRFNTGEMANDDALAQSIARLGEVFVMDAFASAHRAHASTHGVVKHVQTACAGPLFMKEMDALNRILEAPKPPLLAIVGGSKVSTKLKVLNALLEKVDTLIVGGSLANTFLVAKGYAMGASLHEPDFIDIAADILKRSEQRGVKMPLPKDAVVATCFTANADAKIKPIDSLAPNDMMLDVGPKTSNLYAQCIKQAATILWNGPIGVFEYEAFSKGTQAICEAVVQNSKCYSVAGGGDTIAALEKFNIKDELSYISTAGGAFLEFLEGEPLPAIEALMQHAGAMDK